MAAVIPSSGDLERTPCGCTLVFVGSQSSLGGEGELPSVVSRPLIIGGGATRCLTVSTDQHLLLYSSKTFCQLFITHAGGKNHQTRHRNSPS